MMARYDVHTNILRTTLAAFAAGIGGADSVTVLPFDAAARLPDRFSRRLARNSQTILIEEAGIAGVADPGAGAGAVEVLTDRLAEKAWEEFRKIEAEGGLHAAVTAGTLQRAVAAMRERRLQRIRTRELPLIGVNAFPPVAASEASTAASPPRLSPALAKTVDTLIFTRLPEPFEVLRDRVNQLAAALGERPVVYLATLGRPADSGSLAGEVRQVFASGGLATISAPPRSAPQELGEAFAASGSRIACICPSAEVADAEIKLTFNALKEKPAALIGLAGKREHALSGFDFRIEKGVDVVQLLCNLLKTIAATPEKI